MSKLLKSGVSILAAVVMALSIMVITEVNADAANIDYTSIFNATYYAAKYPDVAALVGTDETALFNHFITVGIAEGRQGCEEFNVTAYRTRYADLEKAYGSNLRMYYLHYALVGKAEGRNGRVDAAVATPVTTAKPAATPATTPAASVNTEIPANAIQHGNGYFLQNVGPDVFQWINQQRAGEKKKTLTWSQGIANAGTNRAKELSVVFSSGRPDGEPWQTAYGKDYGDIKEMIYQQNGVATSASIESAIANNTDRTKYILTDNFDKCGIAVYTENNKSYVIISFSKVPEEKK